MWKPTGTAGEGAGADSGVAEAQGCTLDSARLGSPQVEGTAVSTVPRLRWEAHEVEESWLQVFDADGRMRASAPVAGEAAESLLVGLYPRSSYRVRAVAEQDGELLCGAEVTVETGSLPATLPPIERQVDAASPAGGLRVVSLLGQEATHIAVLDDMGQTIWALPVWLDDRPEEDGPRPPAGASTSMRAMLDPLGRGLLYNLEHSDDASVGHVVLVGWDGVEQERYPIPLGHTDFTPLPDGSLAVLGWDLREVDGRNYVGDTILVRSPEGELTELWNAFEVFEPDPSMHYNPAEMLGVEADDWSHVNSIWYEASEHAYYVSIANLNAVARVDAATGTTDWIISERSRSTIDHVEPLLIDAPHSVQPTPEGLLIFNRTNPAETSSCSGPIGVTVDFGRSEAHKDWSWHGGGCYKVGFLGNAERIPEALTLTSWSVLGRLDEVDLEGNSNWQLSLGLGAAFGFVSWAELPPEVLQ